MNREEQQWLQSLQSFIYETLKDVVPSNLINQFLDAKAMLTWKLAFTHETVDPVNNYEDLEYFGDIILKSVFPKYLFNKFPHLHRRGYTELNVYYMSKMQQAKLGDMMKLPNYIRVGGMSSVILNIVTDVFESFFGALESIADRVQNGLGYVICYNMIFEIFKNINIDLINSNESSKTQVIQIFTRFNLKKPTQTVLKSENNVSVVISLDKEHDDFLRSYGIDLPYQEPYVDASGNVLIDYIIGENISATKTEADYEAYVNSLKLLEENGVSTEWAGEVKKERDLQDPSVAQYVPRAREKLKLMGYVDMYFFIPKKSVTKTGAVVNLVGVKDDKSLKILEQLYTTDRSNGYIDARTKLIRQFVSK